MDFDIVLSNFAGFSADEILNLSKIFCELIEKNSLISDGKEMMKTFLS